MLFHPLKDLAILSPSLHTLDFHRSLSGFIDGSFTQDSLNITYVMIYTTGMAFISHKILHNSNKHGFSFAISQSPAP